MMRYIFIPKKDQIPQWKQCYYDYKTLRKIQMLIYEIENKYALICTTIKNYSSLVLDKQQNYQSLNTISQQTSMKDQKYQALLLYKFQLNQLLNKWCFQFTKYSYASSYSVEIFIKMKMEQTKGKYIQYKNYLSLVYNERSKILLLLQNLYIQAFYLWKAIYYNIAQQADVTKQFQLFSVKYSQWHRKFGQNKKLKRLKVMNEQTLNSIQYTYLLASPQRQQKAFDMLQELSLKDGNNISHSQLRFIGYTMGTLGVMLAILIQTDISSGIQLQVNKTFTDHFPIWRGASYILFYIWMLGLDVLFYERSQINYKLVFQFKNHHMPQSKRLFLRAGLLSLLYIILFYIFTLQLNGIISSNFLHLGALFWAILIVQLFIFAPIDFFQHEKSDNSFYFYKLLGRVICTPCVAINFIIIWFTEQMSSFNRPFGDLYYTICFITSNQAKFCLNSSPYASSAYIILIFIYRMIQNLKIWHQNTMAKPNKQYDFKAPPFLGFFRGLFSFLTAILALFDRIKLFNGAFYVWLVCSIITTLYSWFIDIRFDWGILNINSKSCLRDKLLFPHAKYVYYFFAVFNLVLRTAWVLTISSIALFNEGFGYLLYIMAISYLEIFRRGVWNILRIQNQHIKNCGQFKATITDDKILQEVRLAAQTKEQLLQKKAKQTQLMYKPNDMKIKLRRIQSNSFTNILKKGQESAELNKMRTTQNKQLFRQNLALISEQKQRLTQQIKKDKRKLLSYKVKAYKYILLQKNLIKNKNT